jgi:hypothetical protein
MRKLMAFNVVAILCLSLLSCNLLDKADGVQKNPDGSVTRTDGNLVSTIGTAAGALLPPPWNLIGSGLLGLGNIYFALRGKQWKTAALATAAGVQDALGKLDAAHAQTPIAPSLAADAVKAAVDAAHDAHGVPQAIQNVLTPTT